MGHALNYLVFKTQAEAQTAADQIALNMGMPIPSSIPGAQDTTAWAIPQQITDGDANAIPPVLSNPLFTTYPNQWEIQEPDAKYMAGVSGYVLATDQG